MPRQVEVAGAIVTAKTAAILEARKKAEERTKPQAVVITDIQIPYSRIFGLVCAVLSVPFLAGILLTIVLMVWGVTFGHALRGH